MNAERTLLGHAFTRHVVTIVWRPLSTFMVEILAVERAYIIILDCLSLFGCLVNTIIVSYQTSSGFVVTFVSFGRKIVMLCLARGFPFQLDFAISPISPLFVLSECVPPPPPTLQVDPRRKNRYVLKLYHILSSNYASQPTLGIAAWPTTVHEMTHEVIIICPMHKCLCEAISCIYYHSPLRLVSKFYDLKLYHILCPNYALQPTSGVAAWPTTVHAMTPKVIIICPMHKC